MPRWPEGPASWARIPVWFPAEKVRVWAVRLEVCLTEGVHSTVSGIQLSCMPNYVMVLPSNHRDHASEEVSPAEGWDTRAALPTINRFPARQDWRVCATNTSVHPLKFCASFGVFSWYLMTVEAQAWTCTGPVYQSS